MPSFQTEYIPHGFAFDETGKVIHSRYVRIIATPPLSGSGFGWKRVWLTFASDFADAKVRVAIHKNGAWTTRQVDVPAAGNRVGFEIENGTQKVSVGRMKTAAGDRNEDTPLSWLLESEA